MKTLYLIILLHSGHIRYSHIHTSLFGRFVIDSLYEHHTDASVSIIRLVSAADANIVRRRTLGLAVHSVLYVVSAAAVTMPCSTSSHCQHATHMLILLCLRAC
jgi:hypothetical protein